MHSARTDLVDSEHEVRSYLGRYVGKGSQKELPLGVSAAGRWWGRSRSLRLELLREVVTHRPGEVDVAEAEARVVRGLRRWLRGRLSFKVRGGVFGDAAGRFAPDAVGVFDLLTGFFGVPIEGMTT